MLRRSLTASVALILALAGIAPAAARADNARFDLTGPRVDVRVTRNGVTLPIASVPNLQPGDRIWLHPDLPESQSVRYLMVLAFLRGTTNPPPDRWFIRIETWDKKVREEGVEVKVPDEAQQAVLFLAPVTGGDFSTLRSAVQGRPGVFVRASQDLTAAGFEQARIEKYIASMRQLSPIEAADPKLLQEHSNLIASTLALKPNGDCVKLPPDQQYTCLTQSGSQSLLDDGHGQSIVESLTGGESAGLIGTASATQLAGGGVYSAYVGTVVDLVHIMGSLYTARYQYIPAIAFPEQQALNLRLNMAPSFHNPKSVIVIGLPSVQKSVPPPLRAADPKAVSCLARPDLVLPVEGAPLVFSTAFAHDLVLHLNYPKGTRPPPGQPQDIPLTADAFRGGLVLAPQEKRHPLHADGEVGAQHATDPAQTSHEDGVPHKEKRAEATSAGLTGTVRGYWGFDPFVGPTLPLQAVPGDDWKLAGESSAGHWLIAGKGRHIELASTGSACVESIALEPATGKPQTAVWKPATEAETINVSVDVPSRDAGEVHLAIHQFGTATPTMIPLTAYSEPAKLEALYYHAGDTAANLTGSSLDQVRGVSFGGARFGPAGEGSGSTQPNGSSELRLALPAGKPAPALAAGSHLTAEVMLDDGRKLNLPLTVGPPRPAVSILGRADVPAAGHADSQFHVHLGSQNDLPVGDALTFSLRSTQPFPRDGMIEIASPDGALHTRLSLAMNTMVLEDPHTLLATLEPLKVFGPSAFGPIQLRAVAPDGTAGDWQPLVTLVRLPAFTSLSCPVVAPVMPSSVAPTAKHGKHQASSGNSKSAAQSSSDDAMPAITDVQSATSESNSAPPDPANSASIAGASSAPAGEAAPAATVAPPTENVGPPPPAASCTLAGAGLYFVDSVAANESFADPTHVPEGYVGSSIDVPPPTGAMYYLRLRDDPANINTVTLPAGPLDHATEPH